MRELGGRYGDNMVAPGEHLAEEEPHVCAVQFNCSIVAKWLLVQTAETNYTAVFCLLTVNLVCGLNRHCKTGIV